MCKRWLAVLLAVCIVCSMIPAAAADNAGAASREKVSTSERFDDSPVESAAGQPADAERTYSTSAEGIALITRFEGVAAPDEARLAACEEAVNGFLSAYGVAVTQSQFDALVDLRYDCEDSFSELYQFSRLLISGDYTDAELAQALCVWSFSGGTTQQAIVERRVCDAMLFLYGDYAGEMPPTFCYVIFEFDGAVCEEKVRCYEPGEAFGQLPEPVQPNAVFAGWCDETGSLISEDTAVTQNCTVSAVWDSTVQQTLRGETEQSEEMHLSEDAIAFIKRYEGFAQYAYWDYAQWSIGYGTVCGYNRDGSDVPDGWLEGEGDGITEEEADALLRQVLPTYENPVTAFAEKNNLTFAQNEFDALAIFTYGCGSAWTSGCRITRWILNPTTDLEFVDAMGAWCHAGGTVLAGLVSRRIKEAQIYLYGDYTSEACPQYTAVWYRANGGTIVDADSNEEIIYYPKGVAYGSFPVVAYAGHTLDGWYTSALGGEQVTEKTTADKYRILYAHWTESGMDFTDIKSKAWYYETVKAAYEMGLFSGISDTVFGPNDPMNRAMLVTVLYRLKGEPEVSGSVPFTDVESGRWYTNAVTWAYQSHIVTGETETVFGTEHPVTREQIAAMLYRYAEANGYDTTARASLSDFTDADKVSNYAKDAVSWAVANGLIRGMSSSVPTIAPKNNATRAEVATVLVRFIETFSIPT